MGSKKRKIRSIYWDEFELKLPWTARNDSMTQIGSYEVSQKVVEQVSKNGL